MSMSGPPGGWYPAGQPRDPWHDDEAGDGYAEPTQPYGQYDQQGSAYGQPWGPGEAWDASPVSGAPEQDSRYVTPSAYPPPRHGQPEYPAQYPPQPDQLRQPRFLGQPTQDQPPGYGGYEQPTTQQQPPRWNPQPWEPPAWEPHSRAYEGAWDPGATQTYPAAPTETYPAAGTQPSYAPQPSYPVAAAQASYTPAAAQPQAPSTAHSPAPGEPERPGRRSRPVVKVVAVLAVLALGAGGVGLYLMRSKGDDSKAASGASTAGPAAATGAPTTVPPSDAVVGDGEAVSGEAATAKLGDCLANDGSNEVPRMRKVACATDTFEVIKRFSGTIDKTRCDGVPGYTHNYFFDSPTDSKDFVLCLKQRK